MKRLIVNADDLGLTTGVNRAIVDAHQQGIVSSATLMANGAAFEDALRAVAAAPGLVIGCHVDLIQLAPVLPAAQLPSLVEGSRFRPGVARLAARAMRGKINPEEMVQEASAQCRKLQSAGIAVSHFDTHKHTHVFPLVLKSLLRAAIDCGVKAIRNPFEPESAVAFRQAFARWRSIPRWTAVQSLRGFAVEFRREVERAGLATTDGTIGIALTGDLDQRAACELLRRVPHGTWELVTHPGYNDPGLAELSRLTTAREQELAWLTSPETRHAIQTSGIELITYADIAK